MITRKDLLALKYQNNFFAEALRFATTEWIRMLERVHKVTKGLSADTTISFLLNEIDRDTAVFVIGSLVNRLQRAEGIEDGVHRWASLQPTACDPIAAMMLPFSTGAITPQELNKLAIALARHHRPKVVEE